MSNFDFLYPKTVMPFEKDVDNIRFGNDNNNMDKNDGKRFLLYLIVLFFFAAIFAATVYYSASISKKSTQNYAALIDGSREYAAVDISSAQNLNTNFSRIENYYTSNNYKVFRVVAEKGYVGEIELLVLLNGTTIEEIKGINIQETEGHGSKCFGDRFLGRFIGLDLKSIEPLKGKQDIYSDGDILYVTGATVTSNAVIDAINAVSFFIKSQK